MDLKTTFISTCSWSIYLQKLLYTKSRLNPWYAHVFVVHMFAMFICTSMSGILKNKQTEIVFTKTNEWWIKLNFSSKCEFYFNNIDTAVVFTKT